jgi:phosphoglycerate dehydrogenase-like enzyme
MSMVIQELGLDRHNNVADLHRLLRSQHAIDSLPLNRKTMHILSQKDINMNSTIAWLVNVRC